MKVGIRKETQYPSEKRASITPRHAKKLVERGIEVFVEEASQRVFKTDEYKQVGATMVDDLSNCDFIFGVKEVPIVDLIPNKPHLFFSHTIKGQDYNMPLLQEILDKNITLMDYELVKNNKDARVVFFGQFAGYAGIIDSLWLLGRRLASEGVQTPFSKIKQATEYDLLADAEKEIEIVGQEIAEQGLPNEITPLITGFAGYGNVSQGAQSLYNILPHQVIKADELDDFIREGEFSNKVVYKVVFKEEDMYERPTEKEFSFEYFVDHPSEYLSIMNKYVPNLSMLINGIYWEERFPKHITIENMKEWYKKEAKQKLKVIGDITCDINGSVEMTVKSTKSSNPAFVYEPLTDNVIDGVEGNGPVILAVDKLPAELPRQASESFGDALYPFIQDLVKIDYSKDFEDLDLPDEFKKAVITHKGKLTPNFEYLKKYL
ncbi:MAG: bifunctional lysine ketoglutarate reductase /saccharopine dehydrogenase family protein [Melioribacteraceae bacterium]